MKTIFFLISASLTDFLTQPLLLTSIAKICSYFCSIELKDSDLPTNGNGEAVLSLSSKGHAVHVFVNKKLSGNTTIDSV